MLYEGGFSIQVVTTAGVTVIKIFIMQDTIEITLLRMMYRSVQSHLAAIDCITFYAEAFLIVFPKHIVTPPQKFLPKLLWRKSNAQIGQSCTV